MSDASVAKRAAAYAAANLVQDGMRLGLGSGSTFLFVLDRLAERMAAEGMQVVGVPTSEGTAAAARSHGIELITLDDVDGLDLAIDGADEVDPRKNMIKGGGAALTREKIVAAAASEMVVIVHDSKLVPTLGAFPLPVEVLPFGWRRALHAVEALGCTSNRRMRDGQALVTDNGNYILDCEFASIPEPGALHDQLNAIPGVVDNGLFVGMAGRIFVADAQGAVRIIS